MLTGIILHHCNGSPVDRAIKTPRKGREVRNLHVRGYKEEGATTTPFGMVVLNESDRYHLVGDVIDRVPKLGARAAYVKQAIRDKLVAHKQYIAEHGGHARDRRVAVESGKAGGKKRSSTEGDNI